MERKEIVCVLRNGQKGRNSSNSLKGSYISVSLVESLPRRTFVRRRSAFGDSASFLAPLSVFYFEIFLSIAANALAAASPTAAYANAITPLLTVRISPKGITATVLASTIPITPCDSAA